MPVRGQREFRSPAVASTFATMPGNYVIGGLDTLCSTRLQETVHRVQPPISCCGDYIGNATVACSTSRVVAILRLSSRLVMIKSQNPCTLSARTSKRLFKTAGLPAGTIIMPTDYFSAEQFGTQVPHLLCSARASPLCVGTFFNWVARAISYRDTPSPSPGSDRLHE